MIFWVFGDTMTPVIPLHSSNMYMLLCYTKESFLKNDYISALQNSASPL